MRDFRLDVQSISGGQIPGWLLLGLPHKVGNMVENAGNCDFKAGAHEFNAKTHTRALEPDPVETRNELLDLTAPYLKTRAIEFGLR